MFGRRRHAAAVAVAPTPAPQLSDEQIFELVHTRLAAVIGEHGTWTMSRRVDADTDEIFHGVLAHSIALSITDALRDARARVAAGEETTVATVHSPEHVAEPQPDTASPAADEAEEPAAFRWDPAPITVWTDLKKPVTGEFARIDTRELVA